MSRLLEAAENKPPELTKAEETLKALAGERERALEVLDGLNTELREARKVLEAAEVKAGDAEAKARIDGNKADGKALETARKNLAGSRECVERLEGTRRGLQRTLDELKARAIETEKALEQAEGAFRRKLLDAFARDLEEAAKPLDPVLREGFALNEYVGALRSTLDVSLIHPETRRNLLPANMPAVGGQSRTPTNEDADKVREVVRGLRETRRLLEVLSKPEPEDQAEDLEPLPAA